MTLLYSGICLQRLRIELSSVFRVQQVGHLASIANHYSTFILSAKSHQQIDNFGLIEQIMPALTHTVLWHAVQLECQHSRHAYKTVRTVF